MRTFHFIIFSLIAFTFIACNDQEAAPDTQDPALTLSTPLAEAEYKVGDDVIITAEVKDNIALESVSISISLPDGENQVIQTLTEEHFTNDQREAIVNKSFSTKDLAGGNYTFTVEARDRSGNTSQKNAKVFIQKPDTSAPEINILQPEENAEFYADNEITVQADIIDDAGLESVKISVTAEGKQAQVVHTATEKDFFNEQREVKISEIISLGTNPAPGPYLITIEAGDQQGNTSTETIKVLIREPDVSAPSIVLKYPEEETVFYLNDAIPYEIIISEESALETVTVSISPVNGGALEVHTLKEGDFSNNNREVHILKSFPASTTKEAGNFVIKVQALDIYGNIGKEQVTINILETNPKDPVISIQGPEGGAEFLPDDEITVQASIMDDAALATVILSVTEPNGQTQVVHTVREEDFFNNQKEATINEVITLGNDPVPGTYILTVEASDQDGHTKEQSVRIKILAPDTTEPTITIHSPEGGSTFQRGSVVELDALVEDDRKLAEIHIQVMMGGLASIHEETITEFDEDKRHQVQDSAAIPEDAATGTYYVIITATDAAGNIAEKTLNFQVTN